MRLSGKTIGFGITASHHNRQRALDAMQRLLAEGADLVPVFSTSVMTTETRFGDGQTLAEQVTALTGKKPITTIPEAEPLGPAQPLDCMVVLPCTGTTLAKFANAITDSPVLMAAKATLRNGRPVVLAISTNDGLGLNASNLARLLAAKNVLFVPFGQDNPQAKPTSLDADMTLVVDTVLAALGGRQLQPILIPRS
ncbi:MAG: dipicolinate synthase subunit B [Bacillota bacterium]